MSTLAELRRVARYKGISEFTCEVCGYTYKLERSPTSMVYDDPRVLELEERFFQPPLIRCRARRRCEARVKQNQRPLAPVIPITAVRR